VVLGQMGTNGMAGACGMALVGSGSAVPAISISNQQLSERVDTSDEWIRTRTGIGARRVAGPEESLTVLATRAAAAALAHAGWSPEDLDLILLATSSPDDLFGTAPRIQGALGATNAVAFDLTAACSGFLFALITAGQYLRSGAMRRALVIGADQLSRWVDWNDRTTCVLFGDGAAAVAVESCPEAENGLLGFRMRSDGSRNGCLTLAQTTEQQPVLSGVTAQQGGFSPIRMNGQEVYKFAVREVPAVLNELLEATGTPAASLNWLLLHQANQRILDAVADRFAIPHERVLSNLAHYGNTSAATIPLMLDEAVKDGRVQPGHLIASSGFGAGLSWGGALLRWSGPRG
jgi:3-oxoacyl-[acyl-carrier-protein] synthase-3